MQYASSYQHYYPGSQNLDAALQFSGITLTHNVKTTQEVDALIKQAEKAGATITDAPHEREWDGYLWEIAWNPHLQIG